MLFFKTSSGWSSKHWTIVKNYIINWEKAFTTLDKEGFVIFLDLSIDAEVLGFESNTRKSVSKKADLPLSEFYGCLFTPSDTPLSWIYFTLDTPSIYTIMFSPRI